MEYEKLSKLFYKKGDIYYQNELNKRKNSYGSFLTPLTVKGFRKERLTNESYQLFYVNTIDLMYLNNKVLIK